MTDPNTMTLDECRDEAATLMGWKPDQGGWDAPKGARDHRESEYDHPCPPTIDAAIAAMPEGWDWRLNHEGDEVEACASPPRAHDWTVELSAPTPQLAAWRLALACLRVKEKQ